MEKVKVEPNMTAQYLGLTNVVMHRTEPKECKFLLFYDIDNKEEHYAFELKRILDKMQTSYIIYYTLNGLHAIGLTPLNAIQWGSYFENLHNYFKEFYGGQVIRLSAKEDEVRKLFAYSFRYPYIEKLARKYGHMLNIPVDVFPIYGEMPDYSVNLIRYWSNG